MRAAQARLTGAYDAIGPTVPIGAVLAECAEAIAAPCRLTWVEGASLARHDVRRWAGPRSLPLWLPLPEFAGFATRNTAPARDAGLTLRPLAETARDTLRWQRDADGPITGLTAEEESVVLAAWRSRQDGGAASLG